MLSDTLIDFLRNKDLFIFDFDGTIADTEPWQCQSYFDTLDELGVEHDLDHSFFFEKCVGHTIPEIWDMFAEATKHLFDYNEVEPIRNDVTLRLIKNNVSPFDYINELFGLFPDTRKVVVTSNNLSYVEELCRYWNLIDKFDQISARRPDDFQSKEKRLKTHIMNADRPAVFEDSQHWLDVSKKYHASTVGISSAKMNLIADFIIHLK